MNKIGDIPLTEDGESIRSLHGRANPVQEDAVYAMHSERAQGSHAALYRKGWGDEKNTEDVKLIKEVQQR